MRYIILGSFYITSISLLGQSNFLNVVFHSEQEGGMVSYAFYGSKETFMKAASAVEKGYALFSKDSMSMTFDLAIDKLAISAYQDLNDNQKLDRNTLGIPSEPYGFSNNARGTFGPPDFEACIITNDQETTVHIYLN